MDIFTKPVVLDVISKLQNLVLEHAKKYEIKTDVEEFEGFNLDELLKKAVKYVVIDLYYVSEDNSCSISERIFNVCNEIIGLAFKDKVLEIENDYCKYMNIKKSMDIVTKVRSLSFSAINTFFLREDVNILIDELMNAYKDYNDNFYKLAAKYGWGN